MTQRMAAGPAGHESEGTMFTPIHETATAPRGIRVAVVDDNAVVGLSVVQLLETTPDIRVVATYVTGEEAVAEFGDGVVPDVVLMDLRLPGMNGVDCARQLKQRYPALLIMMFTAFGDDDEALFESLRLGASGYLLKRSSAFVLVGAIRDLCAGGSPMSPSIARKVTEYFEQQRQPTPSSVARPEDEMPALSAREAQVLDMLAAGLRYKEIADQIDVSINTVRTHLARIYGKMHVTSRTEAVVKFLKSRP